MLSDLTRDGGSTFEGDLSFGDVSMCGDDPRLNDDSLSILDVSGTLTAK